MQGPLDRAVHRVFEVSWGRARALIAAGKVRLDDHIVTEPTMRVVAGAELSLCERGAPGAASRNELRPGDIVHADAHVIVVAKPPGVSTVPFEGDEQTRRSRSRTTKDELTLDARVRAWLERQARSGARRGPPQASPPSGSRSARPSGVARGRPNLGVVHRLDKETSGLVVFTRTWLAKQSLSSQFRKHTVHRLYFAIAHGDVQSRTIRSLILVDRGDGLRGSMRGSSLARVGARARARAPDAARDAITHIERVESLRGATLVACRLETGRTHQIRIHLSESGHPIVGERVYVRGYSRPTIEAPRLMLHAAELGFVHPATEREMRWVLPMPEDMRVMLAALGGP